MFRKTLFAGAALFAAATFAGGGAAQAQIKIAVAGPMTGEYAAFGAQMKAGGDQAAADINAAGGVLGQKVQLEIGDDACDPRQAVSVANKLASDGVKFVAGHFCSGSSIPASKVYADEGVLEISPASTNPDYTDKGSWNTFRVCGRDDEQGEVAGKYLADHYKGDKIAILDDNSAYGKGLADQTRKALEANGAKAVLNEHYVAGEKDYSALVSRMKQAGVQVVYIGGYHTEAGLITRQAREQGLDAQFISGDALATDEFAQIAGNSGNGFMFTFPPDPRKNPEADKVVGEFKAKGINPEGYTLYTYAAIQIWADAVKKADSTDPQKVAAELKKDGPWNSVIGPITFTTKGDPTKPLYVFYKWENGKYSQM